VVCGRYGLGLGLGEVDVDTNMVLTNPVCRRRNRKGPKETEGLASAR